jgi:ABC-2 type transport system ATP-binding protein
MEKSSNGQYVDPVIELDGVTVQYGGFTALREVTLRIPPGAVGLVGRNGAGKSTLMRMLLGLVRPTTGGGRVLAADLLGPDWLLRQSVGYMPENDALLPGMWGIEQVALAAELCGLAPRLAVRRAHEVLAYVDLGEARYRSVEQYSTGMRQRLKLAVALVHDPKLLLLDEPTVGLDPPSRRRMLTLIEDLTERHGKSLLLSTHLLSDIEHTCSHVVMIDGGRILASGTLGEVLGSQSVHYRLRWHGQGERFTQLLSRDGAHALTNPDKNPRAGLNARGGEIRVEMPSDYDSRRFFEIARDAGVVLLTMEVDHGDLTELYHRLLDGSRVTNV